MPKTPNAVLEDAVDNPTLLAGEGELIVPPDRSSITKELRPFVCKECGIRLTHDEAYPHWRQHERARDEQKRAQVTAHG